MSSEGQTDSPILISYAGPDFMWAEWISEQLQRAGCVVDALEWSGGPATDLAETLRQAADRYRHCIAVLSSNYIRTVVPTPEAGETTAAWAAEHPGVLIPVLVRRCELPARFWQLSPADLREVRDDRTAAKRLLSRVLGSRTPAPEAISESMTRFPGRRPAVWSPDVPTRNPFFTGRDEMLRNLRRRLTTDVTALVPHSLQGLAGVGKTQLALEYAYRFAADYDVVWWIPADKQATARKALADLAVRLDLGGPHTEIGELIRSAKDALRTGQPYQRWLLIPPLSSRSYRAVLAMFSSRPATRPGTATRTRWMSMFTAGRKASNSCDAGHLAHPRPTLTGSPRNSAICRWPSSTRRAGCQPPGWFSMTTSRC